MFGLVVERGWRNEAEIDVATVVVDSAAASGATHKVATVGDEAFDIAFAEWVLVLSDDNGAVVFPEVEGYGAVIGLFDEPVFDGDVNVWVDLVADDDFQC